MKWQGNIRVVFITWCVLLTKNFRTSKRKNWSGSSKKENQWNLSFRNTWWSFRKSVKKPKFSRKLMSIIKFWKILSEWSSYSQAKWIYPRAKNHHHGPILAASTPKRNSTFLEVRTMRLWMTFGHSTSKKWSGSMKIVIATQNILIGCTSIKRRSLK